MSLFDAFLRPTIRDRRGLFRFVAMVVAIRSPPAGRASLVVVATLETATFFVDWATCLRSWAITVALSVSLSASIAYMIGAAHLELSRAKQAADALSRTDSLTGLANRRALIEAAEASLPEVLALVIFDIDRFKGVDH